MSVEERRVLEVAAKKFRENLQAELERLNHIRGEYYRQTGYLWRL